MSSQTRKHGIPVRRLVDIAEKEPFYTTAEFLSYIHENHTKCLPCVHRRHFRIAYGNAYIWTSTIYECSDGFAFVEGIECVLEQDGIKNPEKYGIRVTVCPAKKSKTVVKFDTYLKEGQRKPSGGQIELIHTIASKLGVIFEGETREEAQKFIDAHNKQLREFTKTHGIDEPTCYKDTGNTSSQEIHEPVVRTRTMLKTNVVNGVYVRKKDM